VGTEWLEPEESLMAVAGRKSANWLDLGNEAPKASLLTRGLAEMGPSAGGHEGGAPHLSDWPGWAQSLATANSSLSRKLPLRSPEMAGRG